jgi:hypothetical protein
MPRQSATWISRELDNWRKRRPARAGLLFVRPTSRTDFVHPKTNIITPARNVALARIGTDIKNDKKGLNYHVIID